MIKISKLTIAVVLAVLVIPGLSGADTDIPSPVGAVNDYAEVMSPRTEAEISALAARLEEKTSAEVAIVTVGSVKPLTIEQYAVQLFQKWGIGKKSKDNGILILVAVDDREVRIEVGYGLEGVITDVQSKIIINDLMLPAFRRGDYDLGIASSVVALTKIIRDEYGVDLELKTRPLRLPEPPRKASPLGGLLTFLFFILIFGFRFGTLFFFMSSGGSRSYWSSGSSGSFGGGFGGFGGGMSGGGGASGSW
ncbi:MAG: YgcG family protein [Candidatus Omnitrophica bacterium]|nr:YgcG family protein [Candidatus Omnitrophota bacterium]